MADLITPVQNYLKALSPRQLVGLFDTPIDKPAATSGFAYNPGYHLRIGGHTYFCPRVWVHYELLRRLGGEEVVEQERQYRLSNNRCIGEVRR